MKQKRFVIYDCKGDTKNIFPWKEIKYNYANSVYLKNVTQIAEKLNKCDRFD